MNSRERRKIAASRHNMAMDEVAAYREDVVRDPQKYILTRTAREKKLHTDLQLILSGAFIDLT